MARFWIDDDEVERKDEEERNLINSFSEALKIARSNAGSCDRFISKCNEWCKTIQSRTTILDYSFQQFSAHVSPSLPQRLFVTAFVVVCFLEFIRSMNVDYFFTGVFFCFLLALTSLITAIIGLLSPTSSESVQSVLKWRSTLIVLSKEISLRLIRTRRKFRIIARPDLLHAISKDTNSPTLPRWNYFSRVFLLNFMSWFKISLLALFLLVDFVIIFLLFMELGDNLRSFALTIVIGNALIQYINFRKARDEIKHHICYLNSETEKFIMWFQNRSILETILKKYEFLKDSVLNILKCGNDIDKIKSSQSFILLTFAVIKVSNGLEDVIDSENLQNILEYFFFNYSHTFSKSTAELTSNKKSDILGETSNGNQNLQDPERVWASFISMWPSLSFEPHKQEPLNNQKNFKTGFFYRVFTALTNILSLGSMELLVNDSEKAIPSDNHIETSSSKKSETIKDDVEFKYNFITNFFFILFSSLTDNFTLGSTELLDDDSEKEKSSNDHIEIPSSKSYAIIEEDDQDEKYNFIIDFLFNLFYAFTNILSLDDSTDLLVDDSEGEKSSSNHIERSPSNKSAATTEADPETKYKSIIDFLFMFFLALTKISLGSEELRENDSDTGKPSDNQLGGDPSKKHSTEKEHDQETKYNLIIDFLFNLFYALTDIFSLDSTDLSVDDPEGEKPSNIQIGKSSTEKHVIINETDNKTKYEYILDFLFIFFSALNNISLCSEEQSEDDSKTGKPSNNNFGGGLYNKYSTEKEADEEAKYNLIIDCLFSLFYALTDIFSLESTDLLVEDSEGEKSSNNHNGRSLSEKYATANKADIKTKYKFTTDFLCMFILELTKIFSIGSTELLEDGSKTEKASTKRSSFKMNDYEAKYDFMIDFFFELFSALTNILSLGSKELLENDSEKDKESNNHLKRSLFQKYATTNKADSKTKYNFIIDCLFQLCSALIRALTSRSMELLRDSVKEKTSDKISERNRSQINQTEQETICQGLPVNNLDKMYAERKSKQKEKTSTMKSNVTISNPSDLSINDLLKEKCLNNIAGRNPSQVYAATNETRQETICQRLPAKGLDKTHAERSSKRKEKTLTMKSKVSISNPSKWSMKDTVKAKTYINSVKRSLKQNNATEVDHKTKHKLIINLIFKAFSKLTNIFSLISRELSVKESIKEKSLNNSLQSEKLVTANKAVCQERPAKVVKSSAFVSESLKLPMSVMPLDSIFERNLFMTPVKAVHHETEAVHLPPVEGLFKRHVEQNSEIKEQSSVSEPTKLSVNNPLKVKPIYSSFERISSTSYVTAAVTDNLIESPVLPEVPNFIESKLKSLRSERKEIESKLKSLRSERKEIEAKKKALDIEKAENDELIKADKIKEAKRKAEEIEEAKRKAEEIEEEKIKAEKIKESERVALLA